MMNFKEKEDKIVDILESPVEFKQMAEYFIENGYRRIDNSLYDFLVSMSKEEMDYFELRDACDYIADNGDLAGYLSSYRISENDLADSIQDFLSKADMSLEDCAYNYYGLDIPEDVKELDERIAIDGIESLNPAELTRYNQEAFRVIGNELRLGLGDNVKTLTKCMLIDNVLDRVSDNYKLDQTIGDFAKEKLNVEVDPRRKLEKMIDQAKSSLGVEHKENISIEEER